MIDHLHSILPASGDARRLILLTAAGGVASVLDYECREGGGMSGTPEELTNPPSQRET
jgi:hypothetical protein